MQIFLMALGCAGVLVVLYLLIPTKVKKIETDFRQIQNQIEESLNQDELDDCYYSIDKFFKEHMDNKHCFKYVRQLESLSIQRETDLLIMQIQPLFNINEPSK